jgi:hypothetical protein
MAANFETTAYAPNVTSEGLYGTRAVPTQNTTVNSTSIRIRGTGDGTIVPVAYPQTGNANAGELVAFWADLTGTTGQTLTVTVQDSADNSSFAAVDGCEVVVLTAASSVFAAAQQRWPLPASTRNYVRLSVAASATAGTSTSESIGFRLAL